MIQTTRKKLLLIVDKDSCAEFNNVINTILKDTYNISETKVFEIDKKYSSRIGECNTKQLALLKSADIETPKDIMSLIDGKADILKILGIKESDFIPFKSPKNKEQKSLNAAAWIFNIVKCYNGGIELDWKNPNQYKYLPYRYWSDGRWCVDVVGWNSYHYFVSGLYFANSKHGEDALKKFREIYDDYWM